MTIAPIARHAPAKINLALHVTGRRADGYHLLESLAVFTRFGDRVSASAGRVDSFSISGPTAGAVPGDGGNLVLQARDRLRGDRKFPPVALTLEKNLPAAAGVGGGSSDAAAALKALARHWGIETDSALMTQVARDLGADVPMCLAARPLIARGIGHDIEPLERFPALSLVLVNPGVAVSTPDVFRALSSRANPPLTPLPDEPEFDAVIAWLAATRNDLETPAMKIVPAIADALAALRRSGAAFARMSGSGATCFGIFETDGRARQAAAAISASKPSWFVTPTRTTASGESFDD